MWALEVIVALNEKRHQEYLQENGLTEEDWQKKVSQNNRQEEPQHETNVVTV